MPAQGAARPAGLGKGGIVDASSPVALADRGSLPLELIESVAKLATPADPAALGVPEGTTPPGLPVTAIVT